MLLDCLKRESEFEDELKSKLMNIFCHYARVQFIPKTSKELSSFLHNLGFFEVYIRPYYLIENMVTHSSNNFIYAKPFGSDTYPVSDPTETILLTKSTQRIRINQTHMVSRRLCMDLLNDTLHR